MGHRRRFSAFVTKDCNCAPAIRHSLEFTRAFLADHSFEPRLCVKLAIVVEELVTNALRHGGKSQNLAFLLVLKADDGAVRIRVEDDGPPFDPLTAPPVIEPNPTTGGGVGLAIINAWGEDAEYSRISETNMLALTLR